MNEIRLRKGSDSLEVEVEPPGSHPSVIEPPADPDPFGPGAGEPPPPPEFRVVDRRVSQRYRANNGRCWVGWHDPGGFRQVAAWILDISVSGSLVATDASVPDDRSAWLRLDSPAVPDWAEVKVVALQLSRAGVYAVRLVFRGTCPYAFMKAVAFAPSYNPSRSAPSSSWNPNAW